MFQTILLMFKFSWLQESFEDGSKECPGMSHMDFSVLCAGDLGFRTCSLGWNLWGETFDTGHCQIMPCLHQSWSIESIWIFRKLTQWSTISAEDHICWSSCVLGKCPVSGRSCCHQKGKMRHVAMNFERSTLWSFHGKGALKSTAW